MDTYKAKEFNIPNIEGISKKQIEEHLKLYQGYVKHVGIAEEESRKLQRASSDESAYVAKELWRRFAFEWNGMRNHEYYFGALEGGPKDLESESSLTKAVDAQFNGKDNLLSVLKNLSKTRGSGWVLLYYDKVAGSLIPGWADEHHLGVLSTLPVVLAIDCWEHAYMVDYLPGERGKYVESYLNALNWEVVEGWFEKASQN